MNGIVDMTVLRKSVLFLWASLVVVSCGKNMNDSTLTSSLSDEILGKWIHEKSSLEIFRFGDGLRLKGYCSLDNSCTGNEQSIRLVYKPSTRSWDFRTNFFYKEYYSSRGSGSGGILKCWGYDLYKFRYSTKYNLLELETASFTPFLSTGVYGDSCGATKRSWRGRSFRKDRK